MLIRLEFCVIIIVFVLVWIYSRGRPVAAYGQGAVVDGIIFSLDYSSAVIDGCIVKEGDVILGATVVKINPKTVVFEKNGKRWSQRVRQRPNPAWQRPSK
jgi:type II secretory pathway component PulC